ncbi:hypothetical protein MKS83_05020 [Chryseobacterium sp. Y16C]|uniref:hypothetical protein n=1 Tax=Chryseobacterium sp. Y16C TaxID=2920939 RepID=UPI001F0B60B5|nr:hypothetical protein [Chryseobacterium sp. Y16C]UMQ43053.1 hypothetical protein MKS83_05020 [Chryseobacterium sp. Y16C]
MIGQNKVTLLTREEEAKYDLSKLKFYKMSSYNESIAYFIDQDNLLVQPNVPAAEHSIILSTSDFDGNNFPLLSENDTPYYRLKDVMNEEGFTKENMMKVLQELDFSYKKDSFYDDAERFVKGLSKDDKMKFFGPALYFIGEDLHKLCPNAEWQFNTIYYFKPFAEAGLHYEKRNFSFYDLNLLLEDKLIRNKKVSFKQIYQKVEKKFMKEKELWWDFGNVKGD